MKKLLTLLITALAFASLAQEPVYKFSFDDTETMAFSGDRSVTIYPLSEHMKPMMESNLERKLRAVDHVSGIRVQTENPDMAIQEIMNQVYDKTGERISRIWNSTLNKAKPCQILMGAGKSTTWYFVLSPAPDGDYVLTISYIIEEEKSDCSQLP